MRRTLGLALMMAMAGRANAQANDASATAEQLFDQGRALAGEERWAEACPKFEASLRADPALGTRLNLATCYEHVGKLARAWALYRASIDAATQTGDASRRDYAQSHAAALEPRLARLTITAPGAAPELVVRWDGHRIESGMLGGAVYADAGRHELTASAPGFEPFTRSVMLAEGATATIEIAGLVAQTGAGTEPGAPLADDHGEPAELAAARPAPAPTVAPAVATTSAPVDAGETGSANRTYVSLGLGAAGLAAVGVGLGFGWKAHSLFSDAKDQCGAELRCDASHFDLGRRLVHNARIDARYSTVLVGAGAATIAAAAIVYLTRPSGKERRTATLAPVAHDHGGGLAIIGRF